MQVKYHEAHTRSVVKGITWRVIASLTTWTLIYIATRDVTITFTLGIFEVLLKIFFYYLHERIWNRVHWGRAHQEHAE